MVARVSLALLAVLVAGWAAVLLRDLEIGKQAAARALLGGELSAAQSARDRERLKDAQLLNPSAQWELARALNLVRAGKLHAAARVAERLVREEPQNATAWQALAAATRESDPRRAAQARARTRELDPHGTR